MYLYRENIWSKDGMRIVEQRYYISESAPHVIQGAVANWKKDNKRRSNVIEYIHEFTDIDLKMVTVNPLE